VVDAAALAEVAALERAAAGEVVHMGAAEVRDQVHMMVSMGEEEA
jgi:hypothetical protein